MNLSEYLENLGIHINNIKLFEEAFTHRSYLNEKRSDKNLSHNERLEFLGDAVLELIISEYLFKTFPNRPEGELTSFRAATVKTETLAEVARTIGYGNYLRMSNGEEATGGRDKDYLLANTFEAVLGALYLDKGYEESKIYISKILIPKIEEIVENRLDIDAKTKFQELAQELFKVTPTYKVEDESGPDHNKTFTMGVYIDLKKYGEGTGTSKQRAEDDAARKALRKIKPTINIE